MTEVIGKKIILQDIIEEIKTADFPSISADKVAASNDEIHQICFRYVVKKKDIKETFMTFTDLEQLIGEHIAEKILDFYTETRISPKKYLCQCYDGSPNIKLKKKVASFFGRIRKRCRYALYYT